MNPQFRNCISFCSDNMVVGLEKGIGDGQSEIRSVRGNGGGHCMCHYQQ